MNLSLSRLYTAYSFKSDQVYEHWKNLLYVTENKPIIWWRLGILNKVVLGNRKKNMTVS